MERSEEDDNGVVKGSSRLGRLLGRRWVAWMVFVFRFLFYVVKIKWTK